MDNKEKPLGKEYFTIGGRPEARGALEQIKKTLPSGKTPEEIQKTVSIKDIPSSHRFVAASVSGTEKTGGKTEIVMKPNIGKQFYAVVGSEKFPSQLNKYGKGAEEGGTDEELKARLSEEHAEMQEQRTKAANEAVRGLGQDPELMEAFERMMPQAKLEIKPETKPAMMSEASPEKQKPAEVSGKEMQEAAEKFQESVAEKKKILEDLKKETSTDKKKQLWHEKNYITLEHQRNWAAFAYVNALNETQKKKAEEDFKQAKEMLEEYVNDPDAYEKKNKWEYSALPAASMETEKVVPEVEAGKKEPPASTLSEMMSVGEQQKQEKINQNDKEEFPPKKEEKKSVAEELEGAFNRIKSMEKEKVVLVASENSEIGQIKKLEEAPPEVGALVQERLRMFNKTLDAQAEVIEQEAEKKGYLDTIRTIGENYKKARLTYKGALALAILAGVSSGGVAALLGVSIGVAARIGGGAAVFVGAEAFLEKKRQEKERWWNKNPKIMAALSAGILSGGVIGKVASETGVGEWFSHVWDKAFGGAEVAQSALEQAPQPIKVDTSALEKAYQGAMTAPEVITETAGAIHTIASGENLHNLIGGMKELSELDGGRKENAIANILEQINKNPAEYGVASGDVNRLAIGDQIDMEKIHQAIEHTKIGSESVIEHAKHLTTEQVAHIESPRPPSEEFESHLDKSVSELEKTHAKIPPLFEELDKVGQPATSAHPAGLNVLDINDHAISGMSAAEVLPVAAQRHIESIFGVGERELGDTDWGRFQSEDAEDFLDDFSLDTDSPEEKLRAYLNDIISGTKIKPSIGETILEYIKRASEEDPRIHFIKT